MSRGKQVITALASVPLLFAGLTTLVTAQQDGKPGIVIAEVQTASQNSASEEFIELTNNTDQSVDVSDWRVEYYAASPKNFDAPTRTIPLTGVLPAGATYLLASTSYLIDQVNDSFSPGLASGGGHIFLVSYNPQNPATPITHDVVAWGNAIRPESKAAIVPAAGKSIQRKEIEGKLVDTDNNANDFEESDPTPQGFIRPPVITEPDTDGPATDSSDSLESQQQTDNSDVAVAGQDVNQQQQFPSAPLELSELLPNPASPQTDANDEFIELYNPTDQTVELSGYKLQTGSTYSHSYEFNDQIIGPKTYKAFYISETGLVLANSAGRARLLDPNGNIINETTTYEDASDGQAWAWSGTVWQWTTTPTPDARNTMTQKESAAKKVAAAATAKKTASKKTSAKPKKKAKTTKASAAKASKSAAANGKGAGAEVDLNQKAAAIHPGIIAGVGGMALSYGAYEYRRDLANLLARIKNRFSA